MRVGIIGRTGMLLETARQILACGHEIAFVMTCRAEAYYDVDESHFQDLAAEVGCPFYEGVNPNEHVDDIKRLGAQVCVSINWLTLLKERFLTAFPFGVLNAHAGDLPRYKGNACANWAILNFEPSIGLTVHRMTEALDSGPYILKRHFPVTDDTYITDVYAWLDKSVPEMFVEALDLLPTKDFIEQDTTVRTLRTYPRKPEDARIDWTLSRRDIIANVRASSRPFDGAFCFLNGTDTRVTVFRAAPFDIDFDYMAVPGQVCFSERGCPVVATRDGMMIIQECVIAGLSPEESCQRVVRSLRNRLT